MLLMLRFAGRVDVLALAGLMSLGFAGTTARASQTSIHTVFSAPAYFYVDAVQESTVKGHVGATPDAGKPLDFAVAKKPSHGSVDWPDTAKDSWVYVPEKGFIGNDDFVVSSSSGSSSRKTRIVVLVNYQPANRKLYVDVAKGNDKNPGTEAEPFASIQAASDITRPGDTVFIKDGIYLQTSGEAVVSISRSGAPGATITYRPYPGHHPILTAKTAWNHILIFGSYIRIQGLDIAGNLQNVSLADAEKVESRFELGIDKTYGPETSFAQTNGIFIRPANTKIPQPEQIFPRHIEIVANKVHDVPGGGISASQSDYVLVQGNRIQNVAGRCMYGASGISILGSQNTDDKDAPYRMFVQNNFIVNARTYVKWAAVKRMSDGNGIILDSNRNTLEKGESYKGKYLIANNIVIGSGGAGIQVYASDNADVVFNTVYNNSLTPGLEYGQIWVHATSNLRIENNILVAGFDAKINQLFADNKDVVYDYNIYFGGRKPEMVGSHDIIADPKFVSLESANLQLQPTSPAVDSGVGIFPVNKDFDGKLRPAGGGVDRGAFEFQPTNVK
jgi:hypothetical protein